uniref:NEDD4 binding protein 3 n=1 Tax=Poecilia reticulata TaxID=8081 RepID=A0A3P9NGR8_POERE
MGSVGSLVEKPDASPTKGNRAVPQVRPRQTNGLLRKGLTQREYLCGTKEPKAGPSGDGKRDEDNLSDSGHNSMSSLPPYRPPFRPHLSHIRSAATSLSSPLNFEFHRRDFSLFFLTVWIVKSNEILIASVVSSPFPSASMGHINTIGSLDRTSQGLKAAGSGGAAMGEVACRSMATLNRLTPYGSEAPPPYEWTLSLSVEDVVRDLEERLVEKEHELKQMRRNLDESEGAIAQVFEGKQRLWEKEVEELKRLYAAKLRQVSQHAQRSQRSMQLELFRAQQEKNRLQEELDGLKRDASRDATAAPKATSPTLEETRWQVCQKSGEISLLKQQVRDSQAEVTQKLSEIFKLKTQLRETRTDGYLSLNNGFVFPILDPKSGYSCGSGGPTEERLRAELLLERRQSEAQATAFEEERNTWQTEKDKVIRYQKELQASYLEMYHRNEALERELQQLRAEDTPSSSLPWIDRIESSEI